MRLRSPFAQRQTVTLVIDDGPSDVTSQLLARLQRAGHRAVLFVIGSNLEGREAVAVDAVRRGFALGNHSFDHPFFSRIGLEEARAQIVRTDGLIEGIYARAGVRRPGKWFRFPYLDTGEGNHQALQELLRELGFERPGDIRPRLAAEDVDRLDWPTTLSTRDWALPDEQALRLSLRQTRPGDIIEFHDKVETVGRYGDALLAELSALSLRGGVPGRRPRLFQ